MGVAREKKPGLYLLVTKLRVRNFKSIGDAVVPLEPGVNVLVGPNGSGKTSILEAAFFLYKALVEAAEKTPYRPHSPDYWSGLDLVRDRDHTREVEVGLTVELYHRGARSRRWCVSDVEASVSFVYDHGRETLLPTRYAFTVNNDLTLTISRDSVSVTMPAEPWKAAGRPGVDGAEAVEEPDGRVSLTYSVAKPYSFLHPRVVRYVLPGFSEKKLQGTGRPAYRFTWLEMPLLKVEIPVIWRPYAKCTSRPRGTPVGRGDELLFFVDELDYLTPADAILAFFNVAERIVLLRHPDAGALREPRPFTGSERLHPRAQNLAEVLLTLQGRLGRFPERVEALLRRAFPEYRVWVESRFGRVVLLAEWRGVELPPPNMPDGLIKALAIAAAVELGPSLLLIDEVENSLHASLLEVIFDELNSLQIPVLAATHSPVPVDLAGPERTLIARLSDSGTVVEKIRDPKGLREALAREGVTFSDYVYGVTSAD